VERSQPTRTNPIRPPFKIDDDDEQLSIMGGPHKKTIAEQRGALGLVVCSAIPSGDLKWFAFGPENSKKKNERRGMIIQTKRR